MRGPQQAIHVEQPWQPELDSNLSHIGDADPKIVVSMIAEILSQEQKDPAQQTCLAWGWLGGRVLIVAADNK